MSDRTIHDYQLIQEGSVEGLNKVVDAMIDDGWQPFGSPAVIALANAGGFCIYCQAMVKYRA